MRDIFMGLLGVIYGLLVYSLVGTIVVCFLVYGVAIDGLRRLVCQVE